MFQWARMRYKPHRCSLTQKRGALEAATFMRRKLKQQRIHTIGTHTNTYAAETS
jgi:hypothetical protein